MSVRVRLTRVGSKKNAQWRVVVADQRSPRDGRFIEMIGHYNPQTEPSQIMIDRERLDHWLGLGAEPSDTVKKLMRAENTPAGATSQAPGAPAGQQETSGEAPNAVPDTEGTPDTEATSKAEATGEDAPAAESDAEKPG